MVWLTHISSRGGAASSNMAATLTYGPALNEESMYICPWPHPFTASHASAKCTRYCCAGSKSKRCVQCNFSAEQVRRDATERSDKGSWLLVWVWAVCGGLTGDHYYITHNINKCSFLMGMCECYLIKLIELFPLFLCTAASNRGDVQHAITEFNESPPVKHYTWQLSLIQLSNVAQLLQVQHS